MRLSSLLPFILFAIMPAALPVASALATPAHTCAPDYELGEITGRIMGAMLPVEGVQVILLRNGEIIDKVTTDKEGRYTFKTVDAGHYSVKAYKEGYRTHIITDVPVRERYSTTSDIYLPKFNNSHMDTNPLVERYVYKRAYVRDIQCEDHRVNMQKDLE